jgi:hypothetical protein
MRRLRIQGWREHLLIFWIGGMLLAGLSTANWDFELILKNAERHYGNLGPAHKRLLDWQALIATSDALAEKDKLNEVNRFFNRSVRGNCGARTTTGPHRWRP